MKMGPGNETFVNLTLCYTEVHLLLHFCDNSPLLKWDITGVLL